MLSGAPLPDSVFAGAPVIDAWRPVLRNLQALMRGVAGRHALMTEVYGIDVERGFARNWSRFYRLGRPLVLARGKTQ
jgi:hypothetical protein